jgi:low temperature requirement protein LtrA
VSVRGPDGGAPSAHRHLTPPQSWLELFYDLAFVAAIVVVSGAYSKDYSLRQSAWLLVVFSLVWTTWLMSALLMERAQIAGTYQRGLLVGQMALVLLMAVTSDDFIQDSTGAVGPLFAVILVTFLLLYRATGRSAADSGGGPVGRTTRLVVAVVLFLGTVWAGGLVYVLMWLAGLVIVLTTIRSQYPDDDRRGRHLAHRFGEFTIIMVGESFVKIGLVASDEPLDRIDLFGLPLTFVLMAGVWWMYFAQVAPVGLPSQPRRRNLWILGHFPLHLGIAALAVGLAKLLLPTEGVYAEEDLGLITAPLVLVVVSVAFLDWLGGTRQGRSRALVLLSGASAVVLVAALNLLGEDFEFDLGGAVALLTVVMFVTIRMARRLPDPTESAAP